MSGLAIIRTRLPGPIGDATRARRLPVTMRGALRMVRGLLARRRAHAQYPPAELVLRSTPPPSRVSRAAWPRLPAPTLSVTLRIALTMRMIGARASSTAGRPSQAARRVRPIVTPTTRRAVNDRDATAPARLTAVRPADRIHRRTTRDGIALRPATPRARRAAALDRVRTLDAPRVAGQRDHVAALPDRARADGTSRHRDRAGGPWERSRTVTIAPAKFDAMPTLDTGSHAILRPSKPVKLRIGATTGPTPRPYDDRSQPHLRVIGRVRRGGASVLNRSVVRADIILRANPSRAAARSSNASSPTTRRTPTRSAYPALESIQRFAELDPPPAFQSAVPEPLRPALAEASPHPRTDAATAWPVPDAAETPIVRQVRRRMATQHRLAPIPARARRPACAPFRLVHRTAIRSADRDTPAASPMADPRNTPRRADPADRVYPASPPLDHRLPPIPAPAPPASPAKAPERAALAGTVARTAALSIAHPTTATGPIDPPALGRALGELTPHALGPLADRLMVEIERRMRRNLERAGRR